MPKRPNPFGDSSPMQLKSRISSKHVEKGSGGKMKEVYGLFASVAVSLLSSTSCLYTIGCG